MSVLGIANTIISQFDALASHGKSHQLQQGFQQLAQDLQSGNLSQAQTDFDSLQQLLPGNPQTASVAATASTSPSSNPLAAAVSQLAKDLQSGNATAAQSDLATVQQDVQQLHQAHSSVHAHHHHHGGSGESGQSSNGQTPISTLFDQLGQSLQAGNLCAAQQAYASLQQDFLLSGFNTSSASSPVSTNLRVSA